MPFFRFTQNNSNGVSRGPKLVIIEANNAVEANRLVLEVADVYFEERAGDCHACCGPRWTPQADHEEGESVPIYYTGEASPGGWSVHYKARLMGYGLPGVVEIDPWSD